MNGQFGSGCADNIKHSEVAYKYSVKAHGAYFIYKILKFRNVLVVGDNICRKIHLFTSVVGKFYALEHILMRKVFSGGTKAECLSADVYGVGAVHNCGFEFFKAATGGEQFGFIHK